jgi:hypothetical protein
MKLIVLPEKYSIYKFKTDCSLPDWIYSSEFYSITKTKDELSVVAAHTDSVSETISYNTDWRILKIIGPMDLDMIGVIADISNILKEQKISIFTISTFDTDYILVKQKNLSDTILALSEKNHIIYT